MTDRQTVVDEFKSGLAEMRPYLLSHHEPDEYYRCYRVRVGGRTVHLCGRCSGLYPGIAAGVLLFVGGVAADYHLALIATLPAFALVDWASTTFTARRGWNPVRTLTGAALGVAYGLGLATLALDRQPVVVALGVAYGTVAAALLWLAHR